ncbi:Uncharacterized protein PBTT_02160 [Plasmodiophora brassicae]
MRRHVKKSVSVAGIVDPGSDPPTGHDRQSTLSRVYHLLDDGRNDKDAVLRRAVARYLTSLSTTASEELIDTVIKRLRQRPRYQSDLSKRGLNGTAFHRRIGSIRDQMQNDIDSAIAGRRESVIQALAAPEPVFQPGKVDATTPQPDPVEVKDNQEPDKRETLRTFLLNLDWDPSHINVEISVPAARGLQRELPSILSLARFASHMVYWKMYESVIAERPDDYDAQFLTLTSIFFKTAVEFRRIAKDSGRRRRWETLLGLQSFPHSLSTGIRDIILHGSPRPAPVLIDAFVVPSVSAMLNATSAASPAGAPLSSIAHGFFQQLLTIIRKPAPAQY